ncbi:hypothetical protein ACFL4L_07790 [bacterium]
MIEKVVKVQNLNDHLVKGSKDDLKYWLAKAPEDRIQCVEYLRRQSHGNTARLQRFVRIIKRSSG